MELDIGEVAARSGLAPSTLRFYERQGLVAPVGRNGLRRTYSPDILDRLALIVICREVGFSVAEIAEMLELADEGERRERISRKVADLNGRIATLIAARDRLEHAASCESATLMTCPYFTSDLRAVLPVERTGRRFRSTGGSP